MDNAGEDSGISDATTVPLPPVGGGTTTPPRQSGDVSQSTHSSMPGMVGFSPIAGVSMPPQSMFPLGRLPQPAETVWGSPNVGANVPSTEPYTEGAYRVPAAGSDEFVQQMMQQCQVLHQSLNQQSIFMQHVVRTLLTQQQTPTSPPQATPAPAASSAAGGLRSFTSLGGTTVDMGSIAVNMMVTQKAMPDKDKHPGFVSMDKAGLHVDPISISQVRGNLEQLRLVDTKDGFRPMYTMVNFFSEPVIEKMCSHGKCMDFLKDYVRDIDISNIPVLVACLSHVDEDRLVDILCLLCTRTVSEMETLIREYLKPGKSPLQPMPTGTLTPQMISTWRFGLYRFIQQFKRVCRYCRRWAADGKRLMLWDKDKLTSHTVLRYLLNFIFGASGSSPQGNTLHREIETATRETFLARYAGLDATDKADADRILELQWDSITDAFRIHTDSRLSIMQAYADQALRFDLPQVKGEPRAAAANLCELASDEAEDSDETLRAIDSRGLDRSRSSPPRAQTTFSNGKAPLQGPPRNESMTKRVCFTEFRQGVQSCKKLGCQYAHRSDFQSEREYDLLLLSTLNEQYEALANTHIMQKLLRPDNKSLRDELAQYPSLVESMRKPLSALGSPASHTGPPVMARQPTQLVQKAQPRAAVVKITSSDFAPQVVEDAMADLLNERSHSSSPAAGAGEFESA